MLYIQCQNKTDTGLSILIHLFVSLSQGKPMSNLLSLLAASAVAALISFCVCAVVFNSKIGLDSWSVLLVGALVMAAVTFTNK
jgi:hypothetical protein